MSWQDMFLLDQIPFLKGNCNVQRILDGYSSDQKYIVNKQDESFLVRMFDASDYQQKAKEFFVLQTLKELGVKCSRPLEMDKMQGEEFGYMVLSYIKGTDGARAVPQLPKDAQYRAGIAAGQELKLMHSLRASEGEESWSQKKLEKHKRYLTNYMNWDVRFKDGEKLIKFIDKHLPLMKNRPNLFQHDDYHLKNMIFNHQGFAGVIDFNRYDWGDPVNEFLKIGQFTREISIPFSIGQIHGYHEGKEPGEEFWTLYSLYIAMALISSVTWTKYVAPGEMAKTVRTAERVLWEHNWFKNIVPTWYSR